LVENGHSGFHHVKLLSYQLVRKPLITVSQFTNTCTDLVLSVRSIDLKVRSTKKLEMLRSLNGIIS
jgi:hypothetical protein